ncbi:hypothetical protein DL764_010429 [Monosporascus ibericus]|uniref:FAD dependent oxidoreductase domain-containing protein n=1 Tax=Monosporascus ibericus TaxID=155417 RepID=A0A4Q4STV3_9PEZI|nr:hypothetical protein DL764_010429 [Monosporascus ibericus]
MPDLPAKVDIAVIAARYARVSIAYHNLQSCKSTDAALPSILLLKARQTCSGVTGSNGGHLRPETYNRPSALAVSHGGQAAAEVAKFKADHLPAVSEVIEDEGIDCDFVATRIIPVRGICSHIVPAGKPSPQLSNSYIIRQGALEYDYLIPSTDGGIVVESSRPKCLGDRESWYDNAEHDKLIESAKTYFGRYRGGSQRDEKLGNTRTPKVFEATRED